MAAAPKPTYTSETDITDGIKCYYPGCKYVGKSWLRLATHVQGRYHKARTADIKDSYMHDQYKLERQASDKDRYRKNNEKTTDEPGDDGNEGDGDDEEEVVCKPNVPSSPANIPSTMLHLPGSSIGNRCLVPSSAMRALIASGFVICGEGSSYRWNDIVPVDIQCEQLLDVMPHGQQRNAIAEILGQQGDQKQSGKEQKIMSPSKQQDLIAPSIEEHLIVNIGKEASSYIRPSDEELEESFMIRRRFTWPCKSSKTVDLDEVGQYVRRTTKTKGSRDYIMRGIKYLFEIFEFADKHHTPLKKVDPKSAFKALYTSKLIHKAMDLDLLHESIHWTRCINQSLEKLCDFIVLESEDADDALGMRLALACLRRIVGPVKKKVHDEKAKQTERRKVIDAARMAKLASISEQNKSAKQSMIDMKILRDAYIDEFQETGSLPQLVRRCLNTQAYGVSAYRTYPGRPGEWKRMKKSQIQECIVQALWYISVIDHKTFKTSGPLGRYMPPDVQYVFKILLELANPENQYLYQSPSGVGVEIHKLAYDHALMYAPGCTWPEPTLMRKFVESIVADKQNKDKASRMADMAEACSPSEANRAASRMAAKFSGHSFTCGGKYYNLNASDPEEHAFACKAYIESFIGPVLEPPTEEDLLANQHRTAAVILEEFKNATTRAGQHDLVGESEAEEEENEDELSEKEKKALKKEKKKKKKTDKKSKHDKKDKKDKKGKNNKKDKKEDISKKGEKEEKADDGEPPSKRQKCDTPLEEEDDKDEGDLFGDMCEAPEEEDEKELPERAALPDNTPLSALLATMRDSESIMDSPGTADDASRSNYDLLLSRTLAGSKKNVLAGDSLEAACSKAEDLTVADMQKTAFDPDCTPHQQKKLRFEDVSFPDLKKSQPHVPAAKHASSSDAKTMGAPPPSSDPAPKNGPARGYSMACVRKVPTKFEDIHKKYIWRKHNDVAITQKLNPKTILPRSRFKEFLEAGIREGILLEGHTAEGARSFILRVFEGKESVAKFAEDIE